MRRLLQDAAGISSLEAAYNSRKMSVLLFRCWTAIVVSVVLWPGSSSFSNLDTSEPLLIRSPAVSVDPNDGFGWTVIFHELEPVLSTDSVSEVLRKTRILVGAPKGSYPGGLNLSDPFLPAENRTGLVYSCPVGQGQCVGVRGNLSIYIGNENNANGRVTSFTTTVKALYPQAISEGRLFDQAPNSLVAGIVNTRTLNEYKQGQLMGSFLYSNGQYVVACAQGWLTTNLSPGQLQPRGICFMGGRDLTNFVTQLACGGSGSSTRAVSDGYCSSGSATIAFDQLHIGIPGFSLLGGAFRSRDVTAAISDAWSSTELFLNSVLSNSERFDKTTLAYFGYLVMSGYINSPRGSGIEDVLATSPRDREGSYIGRVYAYARSQLGTTVNSSIATGTQMGEFFGFSMGLMDLTGDGYDDLVVGAPMYSKLSDPLLVEQGRAYVFFNNHSNGTFSETPVILENFLARSRFGYSIGDVGDLNADGYEDVAIGAPYENSTESNNTGAVYVYFGRPSVEEFASQTPQKITADNIVSSLSSLTALRTFGFSIAGNVDLDTNLYKDIAIGSYLEQSVVVLRSLPMVTVDTMVIPIPNIAVDVNPSFAVTIRANYSGIGVNGSIGVPFVLSERVLMGQLTRLVFPNGGRGVLQMSGPGVIAEQTLIVNTTDDFTATEPYLLLVNLSNAVRTPPSNVTGQEPISDFSLYPVVIQEGTKSFMVGINNNCGTDGCQTDLSLTSSNATTRRMIVQGRDQSISIRLFYTVQGPEEGRNLELTFPNFPTNVFTSVNVISIEQDGFKFPCTSEDNITCSLQTRQFINQTRSVTVKLFLNNSALRGDEEDFNITVTVGVSNPSNASNNSEINPTNNGVVIPFSISSSSNITPKLSFTRPAFNYVGIPPSEVKSSTDIGEPIVITLTVSNAGPSVVLDTAVLFRFPVRMSGTYVLYPVSLFSAVTNIGVKAGTTVSCSQNGIDPDKLDGMQMTNTGTRKRRSAMSVEQKRVRRAASQILRVTTQTVTSNVVNCESDQCVTLMCNITRLTIDRVDIILETVIDERYFGSLNSKNQMYEFTVESTVTVVDAFQRDEKTDNATVLLQPPTVEVISRTLLIHAFVWSTVGASLILIIIIVILKFLGFFKRKKPDPKNIEDYDGKALDNNVYDVTTIINKEAISL